MVDLPFLHLWIFFLLLDHCEVEFVTFQSMGMTGGRKGSLGRMSDHLWLKRLRQQLTLPTDSSFSS